MKTKLLRRMRPPESEDVSNALIRKLARWPAQGCAIVAVCAPAGFGKTASLAHLYRRLAAQGGPNVWISLERGDTAAGFTHALRAALAAALDAPGEAELEPLLEAMAGARGHALFFDDVQCAGPDVRQAIAALLARAPESLRVMLAGREVDGMRLARLCVAGRAELIGAELLRISAPALAKIEPRANERDLRKIMEFSDGWPVAAVSLARTLQAQPRGAALSAEHAARAGLVNFVREEIAPALSPDLAKALRTQALVSQVPSGPEATALAAACMEGPVSGLIRRDAQGALALNPVLGVWCRHDLALSAAHERADAAERAARLALAAGRPGEAFAIALESGDAALALGILDDAGAVLLWITHGFETVRAIVERAGDALAEDNPRLQLMASIVDLKRGEVARAEGRFARALRMGVCEAGARDADIVRAALVVYGCREISRQSWRALEESLQTSTDSAAMRSFTTSAAAILHLQAGEFASAERVAEAAKADARFAHSSYAIMYLDFHQACVAFARGQAVLMREQMQAALARWRGEFKSDVGAYAVASAFAAEMELELGRPAAARARFLPAHKRLGNLDAWFEVYAATHETAARLDVLEFGAAHAIKKLSQFAEILRGRGLARVAAHLQAIAAVIAGEARLRGEAGAPDVALASGGAARFWREREARALAEIHAMLAEGAHKNAQRRLASEIAAAHDMECRRAELRLRALSVAVHEAAGDEKRAERAALEALALGRATGYRRSLIDSGGQAFVRRLSRLGAHAPAADRRFAELVLKQVERRPAPQAKARLTAREQEVLAALNAASSDKQIARLLGVSEHAVRFHLKNLYRKLRVHSRMDALAQARIEGHLGPY